MHRSGAPELPYTTTDAVPSAARYSIAKTSKRIRKF